MAHYSNRLKDDIYIKNCPKNNISIIIETVSRRLVMPLYIPVVSVLLSFLLIYRKNKQTKLFNRYLFFLLGFLVLVSSELLVRYSGFSNINFFSYLFAPFILLPIIYFLLTNKFRSELK